MFIVPHYLHKGRKSRVRTLTLEDRRLRNMLVTCLSKKYFIIILKDTYCLGTELANKQMIQMMMITFYVLWEACGSVVG
jgi:hypothetical protein